MKELITLSRREVQRMQALDQVRKGVLTLKAAGRPVFLTGETACRREWIEK